jgi:hypothetical protein
MLSARFAVVPFCLLALGLLGLAPGCTSSEPFTTPAGSGGKTGSGGSTGSGGTTGTGGTPGSGGTTGTGGTTGSGGTTGTGGTTDAGMDTGPRDVGMEMRPAETGGGDMVAGTPTFTEIYAEILGPTPAIPASSCSGATCHSPGKSGMVDLSSKMTAYTTLVPAKVKAGNTATSALWTHLTNTNPAMRMPRGKPALPAATIAKVTAWINAGAKND